MECNNGHKPVAPFMMNSLLLNPDFSVYVHSLSIIIDYMSLRELSVFLDKFNIILKTVFLSLIVINFSIFNYFLTFISIYWYKHLCLIYIIQYIK